VQVNTNSDSFSAFYPTMKLHPEIHPTDRLQNNIHAQRAVSMLSGLSQPRHSVPTKQAKTEFSHPTEPSMQRSRKIKEQKRDQHEKEYGKR
jgi:hypothetical protein